MAGAYRFIFCLWRLPRKEQVMAAVFAVSFITVFLAEIGDKTQLLALLLTAKFRCKHQIIAALIATALVNHFLAAFLGFYLNRIVSPAALTRILAGGFVLMALWALIPDKNNVNPAPRCGWGALTTIFTLFFLAEIGDKTQIATLFLAGNYSSLWLVVLGSVAGLAAADVPVIWWGNSLLTKISPAAVRRLAALAFLLLAVAALLWR